MESLKTCVCGNRANEWNRLNLKKNMKQDLPVKPLSLLTLLLSSAWQSTDFIVLFQQ